MLKYYVPCHPLTLSFQQNGFLIFDLILSTFVLQYSVAVQCVAH